MSKMEYEYKVISKIEDDKIHYKLKKILSEIKIGENISETWA